MSTSARPLLPRGAPALPSTSARRPAGVQRVLPFPTGRRTHAVTPRAVIQAPRAPQNLRPVPRHYGHRPSCPLTDCANPATKPDRTAAFHVAAVVVRDPKPSFKFQRPRAGMWLLAASVHCRLLRRARHRRDPATILQIWRKPGARLRRVDYASPRFAPCSSVVSSSHATHGETVDETDETRSPMTGSNLQKAASLTRARVLITQAQRVPLPDYSARMLFRLATSPHSL